MFSKLNHLAIVSDNYAQLAVFYRALFHMRSDADAKREAFAISVGDGYVGMNINPRMSGRQAGLDHFGVEVDDLELVRERVAKKYPAIEIVKRPGNRAFASYSMHDPAGNYFDLSQKGQDNRGEVYEAGAWDQKRRIDHFALRAVEPERIAQFYSEIFELAPRNAPASNGYALTDGHVTMMILPWRISDFNGAGIERPALEHIGFEVESIDTVRSELDRMQSFNPLMRPKPLGAGPEGAIRLKLLEGSGCGRWHIADPDGVLLAISERAAA